MWLSLVATPPVGEVVGVFSVVVSSEELFEHPAASPIAAENKQQAINQRWVVMTKKPKGCFEGLS